MTSNMSVLDRRLRGFLVAPVAIAIAILIGPASAGAIILLALAAVVLATAAAGFCPLYTLVHIDTRRRAALPR